MGSSQARGAQPAAAALLATLARSPSGAALIAASQKLWKLDSMAALTNGPDSPIRLGNASRTDAVLVRKFDPHTGEESRERKLTIYVRQYQQESDSVLDLAHELVHATTQSAWDPYDPDLTPAKYVWNALEGEGGEVDALVGECRVALELTPSSAATLYGGSRCADYVARTRPRNPIRRGRIRADFYRSGHWHGDVARALGKDTSVFPALNATTPRFYSSTGHAPYPAALIEEFRELTEIACENSRRRISTMRSDATVASRAIAAAERALGSEAKPQATLEARTRLFIERRCPEGPVGPAGAANP